MNRITKDMLRRKVDLLNKTVHGEEMIGKSLTFPIPEGVFYLEWSYGGPALFRSGGRDCGDTEICPRGTKREMAHRIDAVLSGIRIGIKVGFAKMLPIQPKEEPKCCDDTDNWNYHDDEYDDSSGERISKHYYVCGTCGEVTQVG